MSRCSARTRSARALIARDAVRPVPRPTIIPDLISATAASASASPTFGSLLKADPLCQFELPSVVDRSRLPAHIRLPGIGPRLPPAARVLLAPEAPADLRATRAQVHVRQAAVAPRWPHEPLRGPHIAREDRRREALVHAIVEGNRLIQRLERKDVED